MAGSIARRCIPDDTWRVVRHAQPEPACEASFAVVAWFGCVGSWSRRLNFGLRELPLLLQHAARSLSGNLGQLPLPAVLLLRARRV